MNIERITMDIDQEPTLAYALSRVSANRVSDIFEPVAIVQHNGEDGCAGPVEAFVCGLGTLVTLSSGQEFVVTAEHIFSLYRDANHSHPKYMVRVLREPAGPLRKNLVDANPFYARMPGLVDIAVCTVSSTRTAKITPFSQYQPGGGTSERRTSEFYVCVGGEQDLTVRSVVSGEEARLLLMESIPGSKMFRYIINYTSSAGESGTGFVDGHNRLFVLKGTVDEGVEDFNQKLKELGVIAKDQAGYSVMTGSLSIKG